MAMKREEIKAVLEKVLSLVKENTELKKELVYRRKEGKALWKKLSEVNAEILLLKMEVKRWKPRPRIVRK